MPPRPWHRRIEDILGSNRAVMAHVEGMAYEQFAQDRKTVGAVAYEHGIIGEAVHHLPSETVAANPDIPWHLMRGLRNELFHEYFRVNTKTLWEVATLDLPRLLSPLTTLLEAE